MNWKLLLREWKEILALLFLWLFIILLINPVGAFPLNDDWCYAKSVQLLAEKGQFKLFNWGEMTLVAHVYWGALFSELFGFSFTTLRCSNLVLSGLSLLGIYASCRAINLSKQKAVLCTLLIMVNPLFVALSFSFMTEPSFMALIIWSTYFF
jgi:hypothetical protein